MLVGLHEPSKRRLDGEKIKRRRARRRGDDGSLYDEKQEGGGGRKGEGARERGVPIT